MNKSVWIPNYEIDNIRLNHEEFAVDANIRDYRTEKEEVFYEILKKNFKLDKNIDNRLLRGLRYNEFTRDLNTISPNFLENQYDLIFKNNQNDNDIS